MSKETRRELARIKRLALDVNTLVRRFKDGVDPVADLLVAIGEKQQAIADVLNGKKIGTGVDWTENLRL